MADGKRQEHAASNDPKQTGSHGNEVGRAQKPNPETGDSWEMDGGFPNASPLGGDNSHIDGAYLLRGAHHKDSIVTFSLSTETILLTVLTFFVVKLLIRVFFGIL